MTNVRIKVLDSKDAMYWYTERIGEVFNVVRIEKIEGIIYYWVRTNDRYNSLNFVLESDAEVIN